MPGISTSRTTASSWLCAVELRDRLGAVLRDLDLVALELEGSLEGLPDRALVVDDEDPHRLHCAHLFDDRASS